MYPNLALRAHRAQRIFDDGDRSSGELQRWTAPGLIVLLLGLTSAPVISLANGQSPNGANVNRGVSQIDLASNDPRPLKAVVISLTEEFGWAVDYEDPPYSKSSPDVSDITDPSWKAAHPNDLFLGLKGGSFHTQLQVGETASTVASPSVVERIVSEYNEASLPGRFAVRTQASGRMAVVGIATRDSSGSYQQTPVLLDTSLEIKPGTVNLQTALTQVTDALSKLSGHHVAVGTVPLNLLAQTQCTVPSGSLNARSVLDQLLENAPIKTAYYLLYDPNDDLYVLNINVVTRVQMTFHGASEKVVVRQQSN